MWLLYVAAVSAASVNGLAVHEGVLYGLTDDHFVEVETEGSPKLGDKVGDVDDGEAIASDGSTLWAVSENGKLKPVIGPGKAFKMKSKHMKYGEPEALASFSDGLLLIGRRGADGDPAYLELWDTDRRKFVARSDAFYTPCSFDIGTAEDTRNLSELMQDDDGAWWAVATVDPDDSGPFASCAYSLTIEYDGQELHVEVGAVLRTMDEHKVEGLARFDGHLYVGFDDEDNQAEEVAVWPTAGETPHGGE